MEYTVLVTDDESATYKYDVEGWVSRDGVYFGKEVDSELKARKQGATHVLCPICNNPIRKGRKTCNKCRLLRKDMEYDALTPVKWNKRDAVYSKVYDVYFTKERDIMLYCNKQGILIKDLHLVLCKPHFLKSVPLSFWDDDLGVDGTVPDELYKITTLFNKLLKKIGAVSWRPSKYRITL